MGLINQIQCRGQDWIKGWCYFPDRHYPRATLCKAWTPKRTPPHNPSFPWLQVRRAGPERQAAAHPDPSRAGARPQPPSTRLPAPSPCRSSVGGSSTRGVTSPNPTIGSQTARSPGPHFWGDLFGTMASRPNKAFSRGTRRHE